MLAELFEHHIIDHTYAVLHLGGFALPVTRHLAMMWLACALLIIFVPLLGRSTAPSLRLARTSVEALVVFIRDEIVLPNMGAEAGSYTPYFCTLFSFILLCNFIGLVPFGSTATGNIAVTGGLALTTFALMLFAGIRSQGLFSYIKNLVPHGVPPWLYPMLYPIEILGIITKTFALCIRLFANMIAGHFVILTAFGLIFIFGQISVLATWTMTVPAAVGMALFVTLLEVLVAFLQAYIFTFLTAIFTGMAMHPH